jgi:hypothetical protein
MKGLILGSTFLSPLAKIKRAVESTMIKRTTIAIIKVANNRKAIIKFDIFSPVSIFKRRRPTLNVRLSSSRSQTPAFALASRRIDVNRVKMRS